ncbi:hypothetical protein PENSPDRAFT_651841 [Peniophora sp. CONT]|nr:hypothetical protein PENSPDRAFT_651841 [Peniophora sp. CONT]
MEQGEADGAARQADESRKQAARDKKLADEEARRLQRLQNAGTVKFSGSLASKNVPDLQDVAYELGLPIKNGTKDLTKAQLVESIITTLNRMELDLRRNERFAGLYSSLDRTRKRATGDDGGGAPDENAPPPQASSSTQPVPPPPRTPSPSNAGLFTFSPPHTPHPLSNTYSPRSNRIYTTQGMAPMYQPDFHNFFPQPPFDQSSMHHSSHWPQHAQYPYFPPYPPYPQFPNG